MRAGATRETRTDLHDLKLALDLVIVVEFARLPAERFGLARLLCRLTLELVDLALGRPTLGRSVILLALERAQESSGLALELGKLALHLARARDLLRPAPHALNLGPQELVPALDGGDPTVGPLEVGDDEVELAELGDDLRVLPLRRIEQPRLDRIVGRPQVGQLRADRRHLADEVLLALLIVAHALVIRRVKLVLLLGDALGDEVVHLPAEGVSAVSRGAQPMGGDDAKTPTFASSTVTLSSAFLRRSSTPAMPAT
jgi:hypothetical protein